MLVCSVALFCCGNAEGASSNTSDALSHGQRRITTCLSQATSCTCYSQRLETAAYRGARLNDACLDLLARNRRQHLRPRKRLKPCVCDIPIRNLPSASPYSVFSTQDQAAPGIRKACGIKERRSRPRKSSLCSLHLRTRATFLENRNGKAPRTHPLLIGANPRKLAQRVLCRVQPLCSQLCISCHAGALRHVAFRLACGRAKAPQALYNRLSE